MLSQLKQDILDYSQEIGIDKIGFSSADVFTELKERLKQQQALSYQSGFEKGTIEERTNPRRLLPEAKSIISIALAYPTGMKNAQRSTRKERRGIFARASWGVDYHVVLRKRMNLLMEFIQERVPEVTMKSMVDTGELSDRAVAERAGIGFSGKNTSIITEKYGSFVYLGEVITSIPFQPDSPVEDSCGDCRICLDACPTGALVEGGRLNAQRCLAFLTQTKDFLPDEFRSKIGNRVYGCDTCQMVCPRNKNVDFHVHQEFEPEPEKVKPKLIPMLRMTNREFKAAFGEMSGFWRGKKPLQRNAIVALGHYRDQYAVTELIKVMKEDPRYEIRGTAAWALGRIGTKQAFREIREAKERENDERVIFEMEKGLDFQKDSKDKSYQNKKADDR